VADRLARWGLAAVVAVSGCFASSPAIASTGMPYSLDEFRAAFLTNAEVSTLIGNTITLIPTSSQATPCVPMPAGGYSCALEWPIPDYGYARPHSLIARTFPDPATAAMAFSGERSAAMAQPPMLSVVLDQPGDLSVQSRVDDLHFLVTSWRLSGNNVVEASCVTRTNPGSRVPDVNNCTQILVNAQTPRLAGFVSPKIEVPGPASGVLSSIKGTTATVTWLAPDSDGGGPITSYTATADNDGLTCSAPPSSSLVQSCSTDGAKTGVTYTFTVTATNSAGAGPASRPSAPSKFTAKPSAPRTPRARVSGLTATVSWKRPAESGGLRVVRYEVTSTPGSLRCTSQGTSCSIFGLSYATKYRFAVRAINGRGAGPVSNSPVVSTPQPPPPPPPPPVPVPPVAPSPKPSQSLS
jgi:hypothetical protein